MGHSHWEVAKRFAERSSDKNMAGHSMFTSNHNTSIYSWGYHFPLAHAYDDNKIVLINGDRYSVSTARHQSELRGALSNYLPKNYTQITVPFSVARAANISLETISRIDAEDDYERAECKTHNVVFSTLNDLSDHAREYSYRYCKTHYEHRLGGSIFRARLIGTNSWAYFLSGFDDTHNSNSDGYFISRLPKRVFSVAEGYDVLKPKEVTAAILEGLEVKRQGDVFAVPAPEFNSRKSKAREKAHFIDRKLDVPMLNESHGASEIASDRYGRLYIRGAMYHRPRWRNPEHKRISLGKVWHRVYFNTALGSWASTTGRVD